MTTVTRWYHYIIVCESTHVYKRYSNMSNPIKFKYKLPKMT